jgi:type I restriction enzyme S subunit
LTTQPLKHVAEVWFSPVDKKAVDGQVPVRLCNYTDVYYNDRIVADMPFMEATATPDQVARFSLRAGDVLLTKDSETADDIGVSAHVAEDLPGVLCGYHLALVRPRADAVRGRYLHWALSATSSRGQLEVAATGVTRFGLRQDALAGMLVPIPDLAAQAAIADYLDAETVRLDNLIEALRTANALLTQRLEASIESIVWGRVDAVAPLMRLTQDERQIQYGIVLPGPDVSEGVPIVKGGNLVTGLLRAERLARTTFDIEAGYARSRLRAGDVAFAIRGAVGACALVPREVEGANITQDVAMIAPRSDVDPTWLLYVLRSPSVQAQAQARVLGATIRGINIRDLKRLKVPKIGLREQQEQARLLQRLQSTYDSLASVRDRQIARLLERRESLIAGAVSGRHAIPGVAA